MAKVTGARGLQTTFTALLFDVAKRLAPVIERNAARPARAPA